MEDSLSISSFLILNSSCIAVKENLKFTLNSLLVLTGVHCSNYLPMHALKQTHKITKSSYAHVPICPALFELV